MATITTKGTLFNPELTSELFNKVQGHSAIAKLCGQSPMPFAGTDTLFSQWMAKFPLSVKAVKSLRVMQVLMLSPSSPSKSCISTA